VKGGGFAISRLLVYNLLSHYFEKDRESRKLIQRHVVFAQEAAFVGDDKGLAMRKLFFTACAREGVDAVGSAPYVEPNVKLSKQNIDWIVDIGN
jgi:hypothetical protein